MEEKSDKKYLRRMIKELRQQFLEENDCDKVRPVLQHCCAELFENFNEQTHDAWLMQCPKGMDIQRMADKRIKLPGRRYVEDLRVRGRNYSKPLNEAVGYVNSSGKYVLSKLPLAGLVVVSKRLNVNQPAEGQNGLDSDSNFPAARTPLRYRLPVRHPYYGRDYKRHIKLPAATRKALKKACKQNEETEAELRRTADYYTLKKVMMSTTQTLKEKELEVRQSVITGHTPNFMKKTGAPSNTDASAVVNIKSKPKGNNDVAKTNGHDLVKIKEEPVTPIKQRKRKSNGEILVNGSVNLDNSLVTIKEEPELTPEKRRKRKAKTRESVSHDESVAVTIKKEPEPTPEKRRKRKARTSESVSLDESVVVKQEVEETTSHKRKRKKLKSAA